MEYNKLIGQVKFRNLRDEPFSLKEAKTVVETVLYPYFPKEFCDTVTDKQVVHINGKYNKVLSKFSSH